MSSFKQKCSFPPLSVLKNHTDQPKVAPPKGVKAQKHWSPSPSGSCKCHSYTQVEKKKKNKKTECGVLCGSQEFSFPSSWRPTTPCLPTHCSPPRTGSWPVFTSNPETSFPIETPNIWSLTVPLCSPFMLWSPGILPGDYFKIKSSLLYSGSFDLLVSCSWTTGLSRGTTCWPQKVWRRRGPLYQASCPQILIPFLEAMMITFFATSMKFITDSTPQTTMPIPPFSWSTSIFTSPAMGLMRGQGLSLISLGILDWRSWLMHAL